MPRRGISKTFVLDGIYHAYNRGVEKRNIFLDEQDYSIFLHLIKYYLSPTEKDILHPLINLPYYSRKVRIPLENLHDKVELLAYCLMPNHFHLLLKQKTLDGMTSFLRKLSTTYAMYFNKRYDRVGYLFQGNYRAVLVNKENYLLHLSRYIHLNPCDLQGLDPCKIRNYTYSSYPYYLKEKHATWLKTDPILSFFENPNRQPFLLKHQNYQDFVEGDKEDLEKILGRLVIED